MIPGAMSDGGHTVKECELILEQGWELYIQSCEKARKMLIESEQFNFSDMVRAQAYAYLSQVQATAYNTIVAPRADYPRVYNNQVWEPIYSWLAPNPDFIYGYTLLNPQRRYRLRGRRGAAKMTVLQCQSKLFGYDMVRLGDYELDEFTVEPDGCYEITLCAEKQEGNWIRLSPEYPQNIFTVRRAFDGVDDDTGEIYIEPIDFDASQPFEQTPRQIAERLKTAGEQIEFVTDKITLELYNNSVKFAGGMNRPWVWDGAGSDLGGADQATYGMVPYHIETDEALLVECDIPEESWYFGAQMNDVWTDTLDYIYHQSSLSLGQVTLDNDGKARMVIAHEDPGIANWLDPVGNRHGLLIIRWYGLKGLEQPDVRVTNVASSELHQRLPGDTRVVTVLQRQQVLSERQRGFRTRYGV